MKPPPSVKRPAQYLPEGSRPRPSKIVKLRVPTEILRRWPRGRSGPTPARHPLPGASRSAASPSFRGPSPAPTFQRGREPSYNSGSPRPHDSTSGSQIPNSSSTKMRVPLPSGSGRTPLPSSTKDVSTPKVGPDKSATPRGETPVGADGQKKPSLKIKLSFGKKAGSATPGPQTPKPYDRKYD